MKINIMSRFDLEELAENPFSEKVAIISITDMQKEDVMLEHAPHKLLKLKFDDVGYEIFTEILGRKPEAHEMKELSKRFHVLTTQQAREIAVFVKENQDVDTMIFQCEYGQSRSAAVAAAVMEYYRRSGIQIFASPDYFPNKLVFKKVLTALRAQ